MVVQGSLEPSKISTSYVERQDTTITHMRSGLIGVAPNGVLGNPENDLRGGTEVLPVTASPG